MCPSRSWLYNGVPHRCLDGPNHSSFRHRQIVGFALRSATVLLRTADNLARILLTAACLSEPHDMHKVDPATFDPVEPIAFAVLYLLLTGLVTYVYINLGLVHLLVFLRGLLCCCAGYLGWTVHCAVTTARRCSAAVQHLPGPDLGHLGLLKILSQRADWHCALTEMADTYGPIYQARALFFRVRCFMLQRQDRSQFATTPKDSSLLLQFVVVTDPVLALHCLRLPTSNIDKWGFGYSWLQKVSLVALQPVTACKNLRVRYLHGMFYCNSVCLRSCWVGQMYSQGSQTSTGGAFAKV